MNHTRDEAFDAYQKLTAILTADGHGDECILRCITTDCDHLHACPACEAWEHVHNSDCCNRIDDHRFGIPHSCNGL